MTWTRWSAYVMAQKARRTTKTSPGISTTGWRPSAGISPVKEKSYQSLGYAPTGTEENECRSCTFPSQSTPIKLRHSIMGIGSILEVRFLRKLWRPRPSRSSEEIGLLSSQVTLNRSNRAPTSSPGSQTVPSTSPKPRRPGGVRCARGSHGGRSSIIWSRHWLP